MKTRKHCSAARLIAQARCKFTNQVYHSWEVGIGRYQHFDFLQVHLNVVVVVVCSNIHWRFELLPHYLTSTATLNTLTTFSDIAGSAPPMFQSIHRQLSDTFDLLPTHNRSSTKTTTSLSYTPVESPGAKLGHRRQISLSSPNPRKVTWILVTGLFAFACFLVATAQYTSPLIGWHGASSNDYDIYIPLGKSVDRGGREVFWWEQFPALIGFYRGRNDIVPSSAYVPEQQQSGPPFTPLPSEPVSLKPAYTPRQDGVIQCSFIPPSISAYDGLPQGMPSALLGSMQEMGINDKVCYDRIARYGRYGLTASSEDGGFGLVMRGDTGTTETFDTQRFLNVKWGGIQDECVQKNQATLVHRPRTAFVLRTWHTFEYTPHHILMLRAMINELSLRTGSTLR